MSEDKSDNQGSEPSAPNLEELANTFMVASFDEEALEKARKIFAQPCEFLKGVVNIKGLPGDQRVEVAFAGRSNVGKSSLINALVNRKALARTSNTPGRTRELNYFTIGDEFYLVDMPGYGYARASKSLVAGWTQLIEDYLKGRTQLMRLFLLIDSRHGIKDSDLDTMKLMDVMAVSYQVVLTKIDKLKKAEVKKIIEKTSKTLAKHPAAHPQIIVTSSRKGDGMDVLRASITELMS